MREMKDSGIEWIGQIPKCWSITRLKYLHNGSNVGESIDKDYWSDDENDLAFYTAGLVPIYTNFNRFPNWKYTRANDILLARNGTPYVYYPVENALYSDHIIRITIDNSCDKRFLRYCLQRSIESVVVDTVSIATWSISLWNEQYITLPSLKEQKAIADFLDSKCAEIDALSADIQSEIDTLEAYKRSVITEAVTKGLDKNVPMKDSGIEWVGEIPETWDVHPVYVYFGERKNKNYALQEQNLLSLSYGKIIRKDIDTVGGLLPASFNTYNIVEAGDIIIRPTDLQNDKRSLRTGLVMEKGIITSAYIDLAPKGNINSAYFHYVLHSYDVQKVFYNMGNGVRQGLNYSEFSKLMVFAPSRDEQDSIVDYLNEQCAEIEAIIAQKQEQLAVLADYKKSVIYEYVTGKKEVPVA